MGSSFLVASALMLVWLMGNRHASSLTVFDTCLMMMRQFWGVSPQFVERLPFVSVLVFLFGASGAWAGWHSLRVWWRTRHLFVWSEPYYPGRWPTLDAALAALPHERRLRILTASHPVACTVGLWQPQIVLSTELIAALSPAELRAVIGHEWGHVCRRDPLRLALLQVCSRVLWFFPIVRALGRDSARHMEDAADDMAVALTCQPLDLASALVKTAQAHVRPRWSPSPALG
jgi:Zn-dependent protease with chaperone function